MQSRRKPLLMGVCALGLWPAVSAAAPGQGGAAMGTLPPPPAVSSSAVSSPAVPSPAVPSSVVPSPAVAAAAAEPRFDAASIRRALRLTEWAPVEGGFFIAATLGLGPNAAALFADSNRDPTPVLRGGLLIGGQTSRYALHVGLEYMGGDVLGGGVSHFGAVLFWLGTTGALWRSSDGRAELTGSVRLGPGVAFGFGSSSTPSLLIGYELMPGLRYYLHPHVSLLAQAGLGGEYVVRTGSGSVAIGVHTLAAWIGPALVL